MSALAACPAPRPPSAATLTGRVALADGRQVVVRPLRASDADGEQAFVRSLSPASRQRRFHVGLRELPATLLAAMTDVDQQAHVAIVAEALDHDSDTPRIVADARYVRGHDPAQAEFALAVADAWQGVGLGRALMQRLARHAQREGLCRLLGDVQTGNGPMFALARDLGGSVEASPNGPGVVQVRIDLPTAPGRRCFGGSRAWAGPHVPRGTAQVPDSVTTAIVSRCGPAAPARVTDCPRTVR